MSRPCIRYASFTDVRRGPDSISLCPGGASLHAGLAARQEGPKRGLLEDLQHRQNAAELQRHVQAMHAADVAYPLEALPLDDRRSVWERGALPPQTDRLFVVDARLALVGSVPLQALLV